MSPVKPVERRQRDTLSVWQLVELARHPDRPYFGDYMTRLVPDFVELHGDRLARHDPAPVAGVGTCHRRPPVVPGHPQGPHRASPPGRKRSARPPSPACRARVRSRHRSAAASARGT